MGHATGAAPRWRAAAFGRPGSGQLALAAAVAKAEAGCSPE